MLYRILADAVVLTHFLWILFLIFGALWGRRNMGVKILHISGLAFAFVIEIFNWYCPLTHMEVWLRTRHDPTLSYTGSFIIHYLEKIIYIQLPYYLIALLTVLICGFNAWIYLGKTAYRLIKRHQGFLDSVSVHGMVYIMTKKAEVDKVDKILVASNGHLHEYFGDLDERRHISFPVCVAVMYGDDGNPVVCPDFILDITKGELFIITDSPFPKDSNIKIHIYVPPESKLLGIFEGNVVEVTENPKGMRINLTNANKEDIQVLEDYLEERRHLVDSKI